jgi:hypothetical protein
MTMMQCAKQAMKLRGGRLLSSSLLPLPDKQARIRNFLLLQDPLTEQQAQAMTRRVR